MSNAHELALLEKWADAPPPLSPTSPKATKFCCCPNRRRYNIKQPKKSTLHARNIFINNDFAYIDDVLPIGDHNDHGNHNNYNNNNKSVPKRADIAFGSEEQDGAPHLTKLLSYKENCDDYDDVRDSVDIAKDTDSNTNEIWRQQKEQQKQKEEQEEHVRRDESNTRNITNECDSTTKTTSDAEEEEEAEQLQQQQQRRSQSKENASVNGSVATALECTKVLNRNDNDKENEEAEEEENKIESESESVTIDSKCQSNRNEQTIQRFSNSKFNVNSERQQQQQQQEPVAYNKRNDDKGNKNDKSDYKIKTPNKMTITTTMHVASRKRNECGLTGNATTTASVVTPTATTTLEATNASSSPSASSSSKTTTTNGATVTSSTTSAPATTTTTVIKTVAVKRTPLNEVTATTTTTPTIPTTTNVSNVANHRRTLENATLTKNHNNNNSFGHMNGNNNIARKCETFNEPTRSVKERIAALVAGNEQAKNHDNSIRSSITQCNKNPKSNLNPNTNANANANANNMTNITTKSAINSLHHNHNPTAGISGNKYATTTSSSSTSSSSSSTTTATATSQTTATTTTTTTSATQKTPTLTLSIANANTTTTTTTPTSTETEKSITDIPRQKSGLNDTQRGATTMSTVIGTTTSAPATPTASPTATITTLTGCATMPRRRNPSLAANERCYTSNNSNTNNNNGYSNCYGSNTAAITTNEKFLVGDKEVLGTLHALPGSRDLPALDNLDLALNLNLTDDDGEDPYFLLQEYLERVKHEINEVFELHKARQRLQQMQQEAAGTAATAITAQTTSSTTPPAAVGTVGAVGNVAVTGDELSRSTESDSGFDSASGGHFGGSNSNSNKSPLRSTTTTMMMTTTASPPPTTTTTALAEATTSTTLALTNNEQVEEHRTPTTTKLKALPPPPLSPVRLNDDDNNIGTTSMSTTRRARANGTTTTAESVAEAATEDVNIWANKFLRDLDNLMSTGIADKLATSSSASSSPVSTTAPMLLSAAATAAIQSRYGRSAATERDQYQYNNYHNQQQQQQQQLSVVLRPEKHTTIPLQSFNLDCGRRDGKNAAAPTTSASTSTPNKSNITYMRTLSAPAPTPCYYYQQQQQQHHVDDNRCTSIHGGGGGGTAHNNRNSLAAFNVTAATSAAVAQEHNLSTNRTTGPILKIEETASRDVVRTENDIEPSTAAAATTHNAVLANNSSHNNNNNNNKSMLVAASTTALSTTATAIPKRDRINHAMTTKTTASSPLTALLTPPPSGSSSSSSSSSSCASSVSSSSSASLSYLKGNPTSVGGAPTSTTGAVSAPNAHHHHHHHNHQQHHNNNQNNNNLLLNGNDATKKGSTSTIWTSEESILRSVGAVDEDNNSTSSSACEEASGVLSSGKSGISIDSSGLDNDNNESGIGTATPPKDLYYWKNMHNDNESISSFDALRKMKFQKSGSVASSDDPDLLEVLSLCDELHADEEVVDEIVDDTHGGSHSPAQMPHKFKPQQQLQQQQQQQQHVIKEKQKQQQKQHQLSCHRHQLLRVQRRLQQQQQQLRRQNDNNESLVIESDQSSSRTLDGDDGDASYIDADDNNVLEEDEGQDEFETILYCDCEYTDGDASSASGSGTSSQHIGGPALIKNAGTNNSNNNNSAGSGVVLRRKYPATPIMVPYSGGRTQKSRSHSLDTASLPASPYHHHYLHQHPHQQHHHQHLHSPHSPHSPHSLLSRQLHHLQHRTKERGQLSLALRQEPFQPLLAPTYFNELPSPSSASLHSGHECLGIQELTTKSNSAPLLLKQEKKRDDFAGQKLTLRYSRSQSDRYLAEIEAVEACKWLRAAGFPQYAQMYEDHQFPIDLTNVAKDHTNLENDQLQSLYRRLCILNRCANMRLDQSHKPQTPQKEDSDDENFALSENWTFQPHIRRWSRIGEMGLEIPGAGKLNAEKTESSSKESSPDRFEDDTYDVTGAGLSLTLPGAGDSTDTTLNDSADTSGVRLRRTGSERLKDGAKALLRRVESIKSRRRKRQNRDGVVISGPQALDLSQLGQRSSLRKPDAVYSTPPSPSAVSPMHTFPKSPFFGNELKVPSQSENFLSPHRSSPKRTPTTPRSMRASPLHFFSNPMPHLKEGKSDDSSSYYSDSQESSTGGKLPIRKTPSKTRRFLQRTGKVDDIGAHSDSECHQGRKLLIKDANSNTTEVKIKKLTRGGSLNLGKDPKKRDGFRSASFRSRSTTRKETKTDDGDGVKRTPVMRWHSFQMEERPQMIFRKCFAQKIDQNSNDQGLPFAAMSAGQLQIIRKLALVILTGHMERYCPTHRSGWNWELPKFIKKIKMPDYKDKKVFGVPLLLILQRTGQTMPTAVRAAFRWLQLNALDQIGLFRKSGVKSRIIKLKELIEYSESAAECMDLLDTQQAYDVADMLKQYFRDLPESLLTTKMSETFAAIFQHLPSDVRLDAVQCAVLLLPDENREILYALLEFLTLVAANSQYNQMTANNLAVCLAPSLFHSSISTGANSVSASPRRRGKGSGVPDVKELSEAKASHECLAFMIENYKLIYTASKEKISKCNFGYMEESKPVPLEALGEGMQFHNWRGYLYECTSATIKEGREKTRGWFTVTSQTDPNVDIAYKKVGDGHPLRLWRCITEVEGPPREVLDYIIKSRASWDVHLLQCQTVKKLDERTEIFQFAIDGQVTTDFCVLRAWQTDLPRGACVIVETSIDHAKAKPMFGAVRGVVLASRYLIEPCGSGRSRVMHLARVDIKGKTPEWYNKSYGHICSHHLSKIRLAFRHITEGPESKV